MPRKNWLIFGAPFSKLYLNNRHSTIATQQSPLNNRHSTIGNQRSAALVATVSGEGKFNFRHRRTIPASWLDSIPLIRRLWLWAAGGMRSVTRYAKRYHRVGSQCRFLQPDSADWDARFQSRGFWHPFRMQHVYPTTPGGIAFAWAAG